MTNETESWGGRIRRVLEERQELTQRLCTALDGLDEYQRTYIITSWMSTNDLRALVEFQESKAF